MLRSTSASIRPLSLRASLASQGYTAWAIFTRASNQLLSVPSSCCCRSASTSSHRLTPAPFAPSPARPRSVQRRHASTSEATSNEEREPIAPTLTSHEGVREKFERLGLNPNICKQLVATHPHVRAPSQAQSALIPAVLSPCDLIVRAHTGTGKSFGLFLALLAKPRIVFKDLDGSSGGRVERGKEKATEQQKRAQFGITSIILVPSNELAAQYMSWARKLFPQNVLPSLDPVIKCLVRGGENGLSVEEEQLGLRKVPPHILIGTPGRIKDILETPGGFILLGIETLRTLALDEADMILQLPGRFPGAKKKWKHQAHMTPGLDILNSIMKVRSTYSGGEKNLTAGLENRPGRRRDERRPPEHIRRNQYKAAEDPNSGLALPKARKFGTQPLQLVCASATANSVMRHFFGARTGWLRTGAKEADVGVKASQSGRWIDLTGLSGKSLVDQGMKGLTVRQDEGARWGEDMIQSGSALPNGIKHTCIVVDEAPLSKNLDRVPLRNLEPRLAKRRPDKEDESPKPHEDEESETHSSPYKIIKPTDDPKEHELDQNLIEGLAFCFASEGVTKGLGLIPPRWSLLKTRAALEALGLTVRFANEGTGDDVAEDEPLLYLLQSTSARGLDLPGLSHAFLLGYHAVIDAVQYTHMAGRVARLGNEPAPAGKVVTLLRGIPHNYKVELNAEKGEEAAVSTWEQKMGTVYRRLGIVPRKLSLRLLTGEQ